MPVIDTVLDRDARTPTVVADIAATPERARRLFTDHEQLSAWWGPPGFPATFEPFTCAVGERIDQVIVTPDGTRHAARWRITAVDAEGITVVDDDVDDEGVPRDGHGAGSMRCTFTPHGSGTRLAIVTTFDAAGLDGHAEDMARGMTEAMGQIDAVLARDADAKQA